MVSRDPTTGKFVSDGSNDHIHTFSGTLSSTIPAADLSGGTSNQNVFGDTADMLDFSTKLDSGEVFEAKHIAHRAMLALPTTATAESAGYCNWQLRNGQGRVPDPSPVHFGSNGERSQGIADVSFAEEDDDSIITAGVLSAGGSVADSTNGLGAGADRDRDRIVVRFDGDLQGPFFDTDDELSVPHTIGYDNISDHAIVASFRTVLKGPIHEA